MGDDQVGDWDDAEVEAIRREIPKPPWWIRLFLPLQAQDFQIKCLCMLVYHERRKRGMIAQFRERWDQMKTEQINQAFERQIRLTGELALAQLRLQQIESRQVESPSQNPPVESA